MEREHLLIALDALEWEGRRLNNQLQREPKTRDGKPNRNRPFLEREIARVTEANAAIAAHLGVPADFHDRVELVYNK